MATPVTITFLGGLGEIGRNCMVLEQDDQLLLLDCGLMFPELEHLGVDLILPDFTWLRDNADRVIGCIATHGHEDHVGGLSYLLRELSFPIYGSALTLGLAKNRIEEAGLLGQTKLVPVVDGERRRIGPFDVEFIPVTHSVPHGFATAFHTPQGVLMHTGDWKLDLTPVDGRLTDLTRMGAIAYEQGVRLLMSDSTNADSHGHSRSEKSVGSVLYDLFHEHEGRRIVIACFASHVHRVQQIADAAIAFGRQVATLGLSMKKNMRLAREMGLLHIPERSIVDIENIDKLADGDVCVISTGSQGEPMSALTRMANGENRWLTIGEGDTVILSSHPIPGNEMDVSKVIDGLVRLGAKVVHSGIEDVHATGHAKQEEIKTLLSIVEPQWYVPVHGEYRHLVANAELAAGDGRPRGSHAGVRRWRPAHHRRRRHPSHRRGAGGLPVRGWHRRRRRPGCAPRPEGARRGGRGRGGRDGRDRGWRHPHGPGGHHSRLGVRPRGRGAARRVRRRGASGDQGPLRGGRHARPRVVAARGPPCRRPVRQRPHQAQAHDRPGGDGGLVPLQGERVVLREPRDADLEPLMVFFADPVIARWWPMDRDEIVRDVLERADPDVTVYVIEVEGALAGVIQSHEETDEDYRHAGMDISVAPHLHGTGVAVDALRTLARHLIHDRGHHRLVIDPAAHNGRAIARYQKLGFKPVGTLRQYERGPDGTWHDGLLMDLLADELC